MVADIPGLIEGAAEGAGLGHQFLRHVERCRLLVHLLNGASADPLSEFDQINDELQLFSEKLADKPQIVVLNKIDLPDAETQWANVQARATALDLPVYKISAVTQEGVQALVAQLFAHLDALPDEPLFEEAVPVFTLDDDKSRFDVEKLAEDQYHVSGPRITELAMQTMWDVDQAVMRVHQILERMGVNQALREAGVEAGDTVFLDDVELEWVW